MAVNEGFKLDLDIALNPKSLADMLKQIQKGIDQTIAKGLAQSTRRTTGVAGTGQSVKAATSVSSADLKPLLAALSAQTKSNADVVKAMGILTSEMRRRASGRAAPGSQTNQLAQKTSGPTNRELATDIQVGRQTGGRARTSSGARTEQKVSGRTGVAKVDHARSTQQKKIDKASTSKPMHKQEALAHAQARELRKSLDDLTKMLSTGALGKIPNLMKMADIPTPQDVRVGAGGSVEVKTASGIAKTVTKYIKIALDKEGGKVVQNTDILSKRLADILKDKGSQDQIKTAKRTARRDPMQAAAQLRRIFKPLLQLPTAQGGKKPYEKAGEAILEVDVTGNKALKERLDALRDETSQVAALNAHLWDLDDVLKELRKTGVETLGSVGLSDERAARPGMSGGKQILRGQEEGVYGASIHVQTRDLAGMGLGGRGSMRPARSFQPQQALPLVHGELPQVMGRGEAEAHETGMFPSNMARNLRTQYLDPRKTPEVSEDMILISKEAAKGLTASIGKVSDPLKMVAEDLQIGQQLVHGQVLGYDVEGEEVKFDLKGVSAEIESIEDIVIDGIKGVRVKYQEISEAVTGSKIGTVGGIKGVLKVVDDLTKYGAAPGVEVATSGYGAAKRGVLTDVMKMQASEMGRISGKDPQMIAEHIEAAMMEGGQTLEAAIESAAEAFDITGFTGEMIGKMPWQRLKDPRVQGPGDIGDKTYDVTAMQALGQRAAEGKMAEGMVERMKEVEASQEEYRATLRALTGEVDVAAEGLREMLPEDFRRLPETVGALEHFVDTLIDPAFKEALAIRMPERGGGDRLLRMPAQGKRLGERGSYTTGLGAVNPTSISRLLDNMMETGQRIRMAEGRISPTIGADSDQKMTEDLMFKTREAVRSQVKAIMELNKSNPEAFAVAAKEFVDSMMPALEGVSLTEAVKYKSVQGGGKYGPEQTTSAAGTSAAAHIQKIKSPMGQLLRLQEVLRGRSEEQSKFKGGLVENVPTSGELHHNMGLLEKVMSVLNVTITDTPEKIEKLYSRLEQLEQQLITTMAVGQGLGSSTRGDPRRSPYASQIGGGLGVGQRELTAIQFRTDVDEELQAVAHALGTVAGSGGDATEALQALQRLTVAQGDVAKIPRDAVFLNKTDYDNLVQATMKEQGVGEAEARKRLGRPGLTQRYPVTGGGSFLATRAIQDPTGEVPEGAIGVAGPMAVSSMEDLAALRKPLEELQGELYQTIESTQGEGEAAQNARNQLESLTPALQKLNQLFLSTALNLDFDGDKISFLADMASEAGSGVETFTQKIGKGGVSFQQMMLEILGGVGGGATGNIGEFSELFGQVAKGRSGDLKKAVLMPQTAGTAAFETTAHVGPKKSVGLLTDAYNKMLLAVTHGTEATGDAFATGLDYLMLNINESLAQKGGAGGTAGPLKLLEDLKTGNLQSIFKGMDIGGGSTYGKMGAYNKQMREKMTSRLRGSFLEKGAGSLQAIGAESGLEMPDDITFENYKGVVDKMVDQLDLKAIITRMFNQMRENMVKALSNQGIIGAEAEAKIQEMMSDERSPGLDLDNMLRNLSPETSAYMKTRGAEVRDIAGGTPMQSARSVTQMFPELISEQLETLYEEFNITDQIDPKQQAGELAAKLLSWYKSIKESFTAASLPAGVTGTFRKSTGEVSISSENRIKPFLEAVKTLGQAAQGAEKTPEQILEAARAVKVFGATLAHENIHKAAQEFPDSMDTLVRSLRSGTTELGKNSTKIFQALVNAGSKSVGKDMGRVEALRQQHRETGQEPAGLREATMRLQRRAGEEMVALKADPEKFKKFAEEAGLGAEGLFELQLVFDELKKTSPALIGEAMSITRQATIAILQAQVSGMQKGAAEAERLATGFPGQGAYNTASERLIAQEQAVMEGQSVLGLSRVTRDDEGMLKHADKMDQLPFAKEFPMMIDRITDVQESARKGFPSTEILNTAEKEINSLAMDLQSSVQKMEGTGGVSKGSGRALFVKTMREFHLAVSLQYLNKAKALQKQIGQMRASGEAEKDPAKLQKLVVELGETIIAHEERLAASLRVRGKGRGTIASHIASDRGELVPSAADAGIKPTRDMFYGEIQSIGGRGKEQARFFDQMGEAIGFATDEMAQGKNMTKAWGVILEALSESPENMAETLNKVAEVMAKVARHTGFAEGQMSETAQVTAEFAKELKRIGSHIEGKPIANMEDFQKIMSGAPIGARRAAAAPAGEQYQQASEAMESYRKELQRLIETEEYQQAGAPKTFESKQFQVLGEGGQVLQKLQGDAKRHGDKIKVSLKQVGAAAQTTGNQMKSALRRVVQWGFASGIVYGVIRAFRNMVSIVTEVQDKMMSLQKVMDTSITDFGAMQDAAVGMAKEFGIGIGDVLDGMVVYGQQGLKMNQILERTGATLMAVNVTTLSSVEATEALTAAHKVFGKEISSSAEFVDAWAAVAAKHAITAKDLADAVKRSGAAAEVAGVDFSDFLGIVTAIGATTRQTGKEIATGTKFMFRAMRRPTAQKELGGLGISSLEAGSGDIRPAMDVLGDVAKSWDTLTRSQKVNLAQAMAGIRHYNAFIVLMNNFDEAQAASIDAQNSQGFAFKKNALAMQTFSKQMEVMKQTMTDLALSLGKSTLGPVTGLVSIFSGLVDIVTKLPAPILTAAAAMAALGVTGVKGADLVVDSWDLMSGQQLSSAAERTRKGSMASRAAGGIMGIGRGLGTKTSTGELQGLGKTTRRARIAIERLGSVTFGVVPAMGKFSGSIGTLSKALRILGGATVIGLVTASLWGLYEIYAILTKTGSDFEKEMADEIGKSQDLATQLKSQLTQLDRVALGYNKIQSSMKNIENTETLKQILNEKNYKSAAVASHNFATKLGLITEAMAEVGGEGAKGLNIKGLTESGEYIVDLSDNFRALSMSAIDAQNSITSAMQTRVIAEHAKDLTDVRGIWNKIKQGIGQTTQVYLRLLGAGDLADNMMTDTSLSGQYERVTKRLRDEVDARNSMKEAGKSTADQDERINALYTERREIQASMKKEAEDIKRIMEEMPVFQDMGAAADSLGKLGKPVKSSLGSGIFGTGATESSVIFKMLAKNAGVGGAVDYETAQSPGLLAGTLLEKGFAAKTGIGNLTPEQTGDITVLGTAMQEALAKEISTIEGEVTTRAGDLAGLIGYVSESTGETFYQFHDSLLGTIRTLNSETVTRVAKELEMGSGDIPALFAVFSKETLEKAVEATEQVLNLIYVGAMAGIRTPKGGMPDLGVQRASQMTAEQRAIAAVSTELERLGEIQTQMGNITREYSETVLSDVKGTYDAAAKGSADFKALVGDKLQLVLQLQKEAFDLSVIGQYAVAMGELQMAMDAAAEASRDAAIEEEVRAKYLVQTAGAMKGMPEVPELDFGKTFLELTGSESLARRNKGFGGTLRQLKSSQDERGRKADLLTDIKKQKENFETMVRDLTSSGKELSEQQLKAIKNAGEGMTEEAIAIIQALEESDKGTQAAMGDQLKESKKQSIFLQGIISLLEYGSEMGRMQINSRAAAEENRKKFEISKRPVLDEEQEAIKRQEEIQSATAKAREKLNQAEAAVAADISRASDYLSQVTGPAGLAKSAQEFANSVRDLIRDFKKEEAMDYDKVTKDRYGNIKSASDLEGPWARVGKPDFKTDFEIKRKELEDARMRPMSADAHRQNAKDLAALEFDEEEAKIKMKQDIEIKALRQQQGQAEKLREKMYDAYADPALKGTGLQKQAKSYFETLTSELQTSEQATEDSRGNLKFKGVSSLGDAEQFMAKIQAAASAQADEARRKAGQEQAKWTADPIVASVDRQTEVMKNIFGVTGPGGGTSSGLAMGIPAVGKTNTNAARDARTRATSGNASATTGSVVNTQEGTGSISQNNMTRVQRGEASGQRIGQIRGGDKLVEIFKKVDGSILEVVSSIEALREEGNAEGIIEAVLSLPNVGLDVHVMDGRITVDNPDDIATPIQDAVGSVGSDVADARLRLTAIEGVVDPDGVPIDERLEEMEAEASLKVEQALLASQSAETMANESSQTLSRAQDRLNTIQAAQDARNAEIDDKFNKQDVTAKEQRVDIDKARQKSEVALSLAKVGAPRITSAGATR